MNQQVQFVVAGNVVPWQRMGRSKQGGRTFKPKKVRDYQDHVHALAMRAIQMWRLATRETWITDGTFGIRMAFHQQDRVRRDVDNLAKCIMDALQPIAYDDDCKVDELYVTRVIDRSEPRVVIDLWRHDVP